MKDMLFLRFTLTTVFPAAAPLGFDGNNKNQVKIADVPKAPLHARQVFKSVT